MGMMTQEQQDAAFADATERGRAIYERLQSQLEPVQDGKAVAIQLNSGAFIVADTLPEARRRMYRQRLDGMLYSRTIGIERDQRTLGRVRGAKQ